MRSSLGIALLACVAGGCSSGSPATVDRVPKTQQQRLDLINKAPLEGDKRQQVLNRFGGAPHGG